MARATRRARVNAHQAFDEVERRFLDLAEHVYERYANQISSGSFADVQDVPPLFMRLIESIRARNPSVALIGVGR